MTIELEVRRLDAAEVRDVELDDFHGPSTPLGAHCVANGRTETHEASTRIEALREVPMKLRWCSP